MWLVKCDKCEKTEPALKGKRGKTLPNGWQTQEKKNLCSNCLGANANEQQVQPQ